MTVQRLCSKTACGRAASCTLTYNYADSTVVLGPLAQNAEPHSYDMCADHANRLTAPRGWEIIRLEAQFTAPPPAPDELVAIADAVRPAPAAPQHAPGTVVAERDTREPGTPEAAADAARRLSRVRAQGRPGVRAVDVGRTSHLRVVGPDPAADDADAEHAGERAEGDDA